MNERVSGWEEEEEEEGGHYVHDMMVLKVSSCSKA